jgi:uncharacterized protein YjdB
MTRQQARHINLKRPDIRRFRYFALMAPLAIAGCTLGSRIPVEGVKVTPQTLVFVGTGETKALLATIAPESATDKRLFWESTDPSVASVDALGRVTAQAVGFDVFITVHTHDGNYQSSCNVQVNP